MVKEDCMKILDYLNPLNLVKLITGSIGNKYVASLVRQILSVLAGYLAAIGIPKTDINNFQSAAENILVPLIIYFIAQAASFAEKNKK